MSLKQLLATRTIQQVVAEAQAPDDQGHTLKRALGPWALIALGIGAIIGTGIFVLTGIAAANNAGPALALSFVLAGAVCALAALCYSEFAAMIPVTGSAYSYAYATMGEFMAWFIGWDLILEYLVAIAAVAVGWSGYVVPLLAHLGINIPPEFATAPFVKGAGPFEVVASGAVVNLPAMFVVLAMTVLCYVGITQSSFVNAVIVIIKLLVIFLFIVFGLSHIDPGNWQPLVPERVVDAQGVGHYGWVGVVEGAAIIFFAYIGFDAVSTAAGEAKNPQRDMPIGILVSLAICTVLYIAVALVLTGMMPYTAFKGIAHPVAMAVESVPGFMHDYLAPIIEIGAVAGLSSVILVMMIGQPRIFYAMSKDGLMPKAFAKVHPRFRTPHINTLITGLVAAVGAGVLPIDILAELTNIGTLVAFLIVCVGILILRRTRPDLERPFRTPMAWLVCPLGALGCLYLIWALPVDTWLRMLVWAAIGVLLYFAYGYRHSKLRARSTS